MSTEDTGTAGLPTEVQAAIKVQKVRDDAEAAMANDAGDVIENGDDLLDSEVTATNAVVDGTNDAVAAAPDG